MISSISYQIIVTILSGLVWGTKLFVTWFARYWAGGRVSESEVELLKGEELVGGASRQSEPELLKGAELVGGQRRSYSRGRS